MAGRFLTRHGNVYVYVPNLIGYGRVLCSCYAFSVAFWSPWQTVAAYVAGFVCDELDGRFARLLGQTSTLGAVLDMVTDRCSTAGLLLIVALLWPGWYRACLALLLLDVGSHWLHMHASLSRGALTHKDGVSRFGLIRAYYRHRLFMGFCCVCCEARALSHMWEQCASAEHESSSFQGVLVLYLALYLLGMSRGGPSGLPPQGQQPSWEGFQGLLQGPGRPWAALALLCLPGFAVKQAVNVAQVSAAAAVLVELDRARDREGARSPGQQESPGVSTPKVSEVPKRR